MNILGISAFYHDSAACLVRNGNIYAAAAEERFSRIKGDAQFPAQAILFCLKKAELLPKEIDAICFYDKPLLTFDRLLQTYLSFAPKGFLSFLKAMPIWLKEKLFTREILARNLRKIGFTNIKKKNILFSMHHQSHAASAFFPSPFNDAAIIVMDGVGEWATTSLGYGKDNNLNLLQQITFPHSIGLLYSAFTYYLGFKVNEGEYKVMGLAPYGKPRYVEIIQKNLIHILDDGSYKLNMKYFGYCTSLKMTNKKFHQLFNRSPRLLDDKLDQFHMDIAASLQAVVEDIILRLVNTAYEQSHSENLCMAGGVALNCVANGRILRESQFKQIWIQPAASDAGGALGAALLADNLLSARKEVKSEDDTDKMNNAFLGPEYTQRDILSFLKSNNIPYSQLENTSLYSTIAERLAQGSVIGWFQGRMEWGPRALGNRSILANPQFANMQSDLNLKIKFRESFRPFAPIVLEEKSHKYFKFSGKSPYMLFVAPLAESQRFKNHATTKNHLGFEKLKHIASKIPAVTHVNYSARIQTVNKEQNLHLWNLLNSFEKITGCPVLVNTSFNVKDEPIVCSIEDAYTCFQKTGMDILVLGNCVIEKHR